MFADVQLARRMEQASGADDVGAHLGELPLLILGKAAKQLLADDEGEHGIAQELHLLVVRMIAARGLRLGLAGVRSVRERLPQKLRVAEGVSERCFEVTRIVMN